MQILCNAHNCAGTCNQSRSHALSHGLEVAARFGEGGRFLSFRAFLCCFLLRLLTLAPHANPALCLAARNRAPKHCFSLATVWAGNLFRLLRHLPPQLLMAAVAAFISDRLGNLNNCDGADLAIKSLGCNLLSKGLSAFRGLANFVGN